MDALRPTAAEVGAALPGDERLDAAVVRDRGFDLPATPTEVWPWLEQLGRGRAGWYLPRSAERLLPPGRRALRHLDPTLWLDVGQVVPGRTGGDATLTVLALDPPSTLLLHGTRRRGLEVTWVLRLTRHLDGCRVHSRTRLSGVRGPLLARRADDLVELVTLAGLAAGLRERVRPGP